VLFFRPPIDIMSMELQAAELVGSQIESLFVGMSSIHRACGARYSTNTGVFWLILPFTLVIIRRNILTHGWVLMNIALLCGAMLFTVLITLVRGLPVLIATE
jgi:hypothetical protein